MSNTRVATRVTWGAALTIVSALTASLFNGFASAHPYLTLFIRLYCNGSYVTLYFYVPYSLPQSDKN